MNKKELEAMDRKSLLDRVSAIKKDLFDLRLELSAGQLKDYSKFKKLRKDAARILTVLRQRING